MTNLESVHRHYRKMRREQRCVRCSSRDWRTLRGRTLCFQCAGRQSRAERTRWRRRHPIERQCIKWLAAKTNWRLPTPDSRLPEVA